MFGDGRHHPDLLLQEKEKTGQSPLPQEKEKTGQFPLPWERVRVRA